ncbi:hypothetical protein CALCODRAFT_70157 [Calocera cornea HHB12733]|uniref:Uncharacterized protein n=1 Tax=Calocera cornea HHB12733 TaxID=1353952 RepID=A0A165IQF2_9BASI|nr:hypothetical protein CALCODRAFT_70157 [Calocera cornea HHB12733]
MTGSTLASSSYGPALQRQHTLRPQQQQQQPQSQIQAQARRPKLLIPSASSPLAGGSYAARSEREKGKAPEQEREREHGPQTADEREPWTLSLAALERFLSARDEHRVLFILGDPPATALHPLLSSPSLAGSLVLLASLSPSPLPAPMLHPIPPSHPTIRTLKPESGSSSKAPQPEAVRVMRLLERGERAARAWRRQQQQQHHHHHLQQSFLASSVGEAQRELDSLSELSSPGTPPTPEHSRPPSPNASASGGGGVFGFSRIARRASGSPAGASPLPKERAFDAVVLFLPAHLLTSAAALGGSDFEFRAHAAHAQLKLAILVSTLAAPFLVSRREAEAARADKRTSGESAASLELNSPSEKRGMLGMLRPKMRKLSSSSSASTSTSTTSSSARRPPPIQLPHSLSTSTSNSSSSTLPNSLAFSLSSHSHAPLSLPAQLVHVLPPSLDKPTQATLARSLDGFLASFHSGSARSAPDSPGALAMQTIHTSLLPLGALADPVSLPVTSNIRLVQAEQRFSPLELLLAGCVRPPAGRTTRWLPSLHPPDTLLLPSHVLTASASSASPLSGHSGPPSAPLSSASTEGSPLLSPSHPLSKLSIPIRSHVLHSRAEGLGKHRSGHEDRRALVLDPGLQGALPTPPESEGSEEGGVGDGDEVRTPTTAGSVATVKKRRGRGRAVHQDGVYTSGQDGVGEGRGVFLLEYCIPDYM